MSTKGVVSNDAYGDIMSAIVKLLEEADLHEQNMSTTEWEALQEIRLTIEAVDPSALGGT